ncbi:MAG: aminopeptidase P family protein [Ruminococcus sp.]|nr:aminopeptidase P family protein [Candidatus Apopatosoma intestinale]
MTHIESVREKLGADALLVTDEKTGFYLTGFFASDATVFITAHSATLFTDSRYIEAAEKEVTTCTPKVPDPSLSEEIKKIIAAEGIHTVAFEDQKMTVAELNRLKAVYNTVEFVPAGDLITLLCEHKTPEEMEAIRAAQAVGDAAFAEVLPLLRPEMTEIEVAAELEYRMKRHGATGPSFETIAVSGTQSSRPHGVPRNVKLEKGFLTMDFGCILNGYCSDMTRTVCLGKADSEMKKVYATVLEAQLAGIEAVRAGVSGASVDKVARDIIYGAGYKGYFGHSLGHGVGMYIHESPRLAPRYERLLEIGHVVTVEPGIYLPGKYGVRIEDMMEITENGPVDITGSPKNLIEI